MNTTPDAYFDNGDAELMRHPWLRESVGWRCVQGLKKNRDKELVVDLTTDRKILSSTVILGASLALAQRWRKTIKEERVGVVFPPGAGCILANLGLMLAGKIPVNLNFTLGRPTLELSLKKAGIQTVITAKPLKDKFADFPWPRHTLDILKEREALGKPKLLSWILAAAVLPAGLLAKLGGVTKQGGEKEAGLLFSSGSTGEPKGVQLSHRNILANCIQVHESGVLDRREKLLAFLPIFHSFGFTVTLWYPLIYGLKLVTLPSPLDAKKAAQAVADEEVTILVGAPTFYRPHFKRTDPAQLASLKWVVGGAEKTPAGFHQQWEQTFGSRYLEGYGLTETSPVVSVNLPERRAHGTNKVLPEASRVGSVGRLFYGMAARITDAASGEVLPMGAVGMLELRGANVFAGYLDDPDLTESVFRDGWFITGDLGRLDEDGYLYIEGRVSRFSKIGGEMVPHGTVEQAVAKALGLEDAETPQVSITGVTDPQKGEALVLLSTVPLDSDSLRQKLQSAGLPNLWIPKKIVEVEAIPMLPSGKLDLKAMAKRASQES